MTPVKFPSGPFYILHIPQFAPYSQFLALQPRLGQNVPPPLNPAECYWMPFNPSAEQLWMALPIGTNNTSAVIVNGGSPNTSDTLTYDTSKTWIFLGGRDITSMEQLWRLQETTGSIQETPDATFSIAAFTDPNQVMDDVNDQLNGVNIAAANSGRTQSFFIYPEEGSIDYGSTTYTNQAVVHNGSQVSGLTTTFGNDIIADNSQGTTNLTGSKEIDFTTSSSTTLSQTDSTTSTESLTASLKVGGKFAEILSIDASLEFSVTESTTISMTSSQTQTSEQSYKYMFDMDVPPGKKYQYLITTFAPNYTADYTCNAVITPSFPGAQPYILPLTGKYAGYNTTTVLFQVLDVTDSATAGIANKIVSESLIFSKAKGSSDAKFGKVVKTIK